MNILEHNKKKFLFLEGEESAKDFINGDIDKFTLPEGWDLDKVEKELTSGIIIAADGIAQFRKARWWSYMIAPNTEKKRLLPLQGKGIETYGFYTLPKIPLRILRQTESFFEEVYKKHKSEAYVALWVNPNNPKDWKISVPEQEVSGAAAEYKNLQDGFPGEPYEYAGDIHSHASMPAGHSGVDDSDELNRLPGWHITIGNLDSSTHSYSCRIVFGIFTDGNIPLNKAFDMPLDKEEHPEDWINKVKPKSYAFSSSKFRGTEWANWDNDGEDWGERWGYGSYRSPSSYFPKKKEKVQVPDLIGMRFDSQKDGEYITAVLEKVEAA